MVNIWLDDERVAPLGFIHCRNVREFREVLEEYDSISVISLDHDLGLIPGTTAYEPTGARALDVLVESDRWPSLGVIIHTANPVAGEQMLKTLDRYSPYEYRRGRIRSSVDPQIVFDLTLDQSV